MRGHLFRFMLVNPALSLAIGVSALMAIGLPAIWLWTGSVANDFGVYWRTANLPLYWAYWHGFEYPFPYMPTMLLWIAPLKLIPQWFAFIAWVAVSILALVRACRPHLSRPELWLLILSPALTNGLLTGQVSAVMAALVIYACSTRSRYAAGIAFGVVASIKPQLVVMVPMLLLLRKDWRAIAGAALTFYLLVGLSLLAFGTATWSAWIGSLPDFRYVLIVSGIDGISPAAVADGFGLPPYPFMALGACVGAWLVFICRTLGPIEMAAAIGAGSILAAPYALTYDLALIMPFVVRTIFMGSFAGAVALSGVFPPLPILLTSFELFRRANGKGVQKLSRMAEGAAGDGSAGLRTLRPLV